MSAPTYALIEKVRDLVRDRAALLLDGRYFSADEAPGGLLLDVASSEIASDDIGDHIACAFTAHPDGTLRCSHGHRHEGWCYTAEQVALLRRAALDVWAGYEGQPCGICLGPLDDMNNYEIVSASLLERDLALRCAFAGLNRSGACGPQVAHRTCVRREYEP